MVGPRLPVGCHHTRDSTTGNGSLAQPIAQSVDLIDGSGEAIACTGGIAVCASGRLIVADSATGQVWVVDPGQQAQPLFRPPDATGVVEHLGQRPAPARSVSVMGPTDVCVDAAETIWVADPAWNQVLAVDSSGEARHVIGPSGDTFDVLLRKGPKGWLAPRTRLWNPSALAVLPDGSVLIGCAAGDMPNHYVVRVTDQERVFAVAGNGIKGSAGDGGPATAANIYRVQGLALDPNGGFYFSSGWNTVRRVDQDGIIHAFAGGRKGYSGDGGPAVDAQLAQPRGIACGSDGSVYIADSDNGCVRRVEADGEISTLLGAGHGLIRNDDGELEELRLHAPWGLAFDPSGRLLVTDGGRLLSVDLSSSVTATTPTRPSSDDDPVEGGASEEKPTFTRLRRPALGPALDHPVLGDVLQRMYREPEGDELTRLGTIPSDDGWYQGSPAVERGERGWQDSDQNAFDEVWNEQASLLMVGAVDALQWQWPEALESAVRRHLAPVWEGIERLAHRAGFWSQGPFAPTRRLPFAERARLGGFEDRCRATLRVGALHAHLRQGTVPIPSKSPVACALCGEGFLEGSTHRLAFKHWGAPRYCGNCSVTAYWGYSPVRDLPTIASSLQRFSSALGWIPASDFRHLEMPASLDESVRDQAMAELVVLPDLSTIREVFGSPWLGVLQQTGLVDEAWRPAYGTHSIAADGHPCRSLFERQVDDWLYANGVGHEVEPAWPRHSTLNASGRLRADWRLQDGTYVEAAGMMGRPDYAAKIGRKVDLAAATGIRLVVIEPSDLAMLHVLLTP